MPVTISNPVLPGFHPDPSILRTDTGYYLATSTFEWRPGIRLHYSPDLVTWNPAGHVLTDPAHWDMPGIPDSGGVWAPSLSYRDGLFWLVFAIVSTKDGPFKDMDVMLVTAPSIEGPWSAPRRLGGDGFDPSVFHDEDGRHWLVNMRWDHRPDHPSFAGITLQELTADGRLHGAPQVIHRQAELVEGPNIYRRDGWYLLMLAEGGTGWNHGITVLRSRELAGPYEPDPAGPLLTTRDDPGSPLQKAGHGELVETPDGEWYLAHLASRPVQTPAGRRSVLGRETCLQPIEWTADGWPRLAHGGHRPAETVPAPAAARAAAPAGPREYRDDFEAPALSGEWSSPRRSAEPGWADLTTRPGTLRLRGGRSLFSRDGQSLVARRLTAHRAQAETLVRVRPEGPGRQAGLICWYDTTSFAFLAVAGSERGPRLVLATADEGAYAEHDTGFAVPDGAAVLRAHFDGPALRFSASLDGERWADTGPVLDAGVLSDDHGSRLRFTGAHVGLAAVDPADRALVAEFDHFSYRTL